MMDVHQKSGFNSHEIHLLFGFHRNRYCSSWEMLGPERQNFFQEGSRSPFPGGLLWSFNEARRDRRMFLSL